MTRALRVAIVTPAVNRRGGTEKCMAWLVEDLSRTCDVTLFTGEVEGADVSRTRVRSLPMIKHPRLLRYLTFLLSNTVALGVRRMLRRPFFDVVLATGGDCFWSDVVYAHFCSAAWSDMLERGEVGLPSANLRQRLRNLHYRLFLAVAARVERAIYRRPRVRRTIAVSRGTMGELVRYYGIPPDTIAVVPNAVDDRVHLSPSERLEHRARVRARHGIPQGAAVLLFVAAGDWKRKGLLVVLEALALLADTDARLLVVGREDIRFYREQADRLGVSGRVVFAGFTPDVERYYAAADLFVYPSAYEAFSLVSLEAAGAGLPLLVTRINGTEDLVREGANGFFIRPDPADLAARARLLLTDPERRERMAAAAAEHSRAYTRASVTGRILSLLESGADPSRRADPVRDPG